MAWPFSGGARAATDDDAKVTEGHLKVLSNVPIEQVPHPEEGELSEEDAWTIRPGPARAKLNSIGSVASTTQALAPSAPAQVNATVDTSGLERLISSRLDMVEDVLRMVETRVDEAMESGPSGTFSDEDGEDAGMDVMSGDVIITASGERIPAGDGASRLKPEDEAPLVELYEAQALAANPFLRAPDALGGAGSDRIGAPTVAALLLDHMTGMAASSFTQKAMDSGMLSPDEGRQVMAIVQLAEPGETEAALADHLPNRALLSFSALVSAWRNQAQRAANSAASSMRA